MYEGVHEACERADTDDDVRVLVLRGAGDKAFLSGTDLSGTDMGQFEAFENGSDGVGYEARISRVLDRLVGTAVPTVAAVHGYCIGGLALAAACDLRIATGSSRFGIPVARTLGNCGPPSGPSRAPGCTKGDDLVEQVWSWSTAARTSATPCGPSRSSSGRPGRDGECGR